VLPSCDAQSCTHSAALFPCARLPTQRAVDAPCLPAAGDDARHAFKGTARDAEHALSKAEIEASTAAEETKHKGRSWLARLFGRGKVRAPRRSAPACYSLCVGQARMPNSPTPFASFVTHCQHPPASAIPPLQGVAEDTRHAARESQIAAETAAAEATHKSKGWWSRMWGRGEVRRQPSSCSSF